MGFAEKLRTRFHFPFQPGYFADAGRADSRGNFFCSRKNNSGEQKTAVEE